MRRIAAFLFLFFCAQPLFAQGIDHSAFDAFLKKVVAEDGSINYAVAKASRADLDFYLDQIESISELQLAAYPKPEQLAFWLNVYHAGLLALILDYYPIKSISEIPSFWERQFLHFGKSMKDGVLVSEESGVSLTQVRNEKLMTNFKDEKIHTGLAWAARGGPVFPKEAFTGPKALGQLFKKTRFEMTRPSMVQIDPTSQSVKLSRVFEWFKPDFVENFGRPERRAKLSKPDSAVVNFLIRYTKDAEKIKFLKTGKFKIEYMEFDWALNDISPS